MQANPQFVVWNRITVSRRGDIIGVRKLESGQRQFLMRNEALSTPYYVATESDRIPQKE
jgi:hypothetical protein